MEYRYRPMHRFPRMTTTRFDITALLYSRSTDLISDCHGVNCEIHLLLQILCRMGDYICTYLAKIPGFLWQNLPHIISGLCWCQ